MPLHIVYALSLSSLSSPHEETRRTHPSANLAKNQTSHDLDLGLAVSIIMRDASLLSEQHSMVQSMVHSL